MTAHDDEFDDFLARVDDVEETLAGLRRYRPVLDPKIDQVTKGSPNSGGARAKAEAEAKAREAAEERRRKEEYREAHKEELEQLKQDYYLRKATRERWEQFRAQNKSRAFTDYYRGWDLFEEDPDEELFRGDTPAAVQDQAAFDAMAKDVEERTQRRREQKAACDKEREAGNLAFKAGQYTEALAAYSRAAEHFKGDKAVYANRALAHLKLRNALSALEDASRAIEIAKFLDEDHDRRPPPKGLVKAYVRRALACGELGRWEEGLKDLDEAAGMAAEGEQPEIRRHAKTLRDDWAAARAEEEQLAAAPPDAAAGDGDDDSAPAASGPQRVRIWSTSCARRRRRRRRRRAPTTVVARRCASWARRWARRRAASSSARRAASRSSSSSSPPTRRPSRRSSSTPALTAATNWNSIAAAACPLRCARCAASRPPRPPPATARLPSRPTMSRRRRRCRRRRRRSSRRSFTCSRAAAP